MEPVFSQSALLDPFEDLKKEFDAWQKSLVAKLCEAERGIAKGNGAQTRRYVVYREIFDATLPWIEAWFEELIALLREAGHVCHRMPKDTPNH